MPIDICYVLSILYFDSVKGLLWKRSSDVLPVELKSHLAACVFQSCNCAAKKDGKFCVALVKVLQGLRRACCTNRSHIFL